MPGFARATEKASGAAARPRLTARPQQAVPARGAISDAAHVRPMMAPAFDFGRLDVRAPSLRRGPESSADLAGTVHEATRQGDPGGAARLPHLEQIQRSFGHHDVGKVQVRQDDGARQMARMLRSRAYAAGETVVFDRTPDLRTAAHEAAHVVQQRAGVRLPEGFSQRGDLYERHAEAVASRVLQRKSAEGLLDALGPAGSRGPHSPVVQRAGIDTDYGTFDTSKYDNVGSAGSEYGVDIELSFDPDRTKVNAKKIGLTQTVRSQLASKNVSLFPVMNNRMVQSGTGEGMQVDRYGGGKYGNPLYPTNAPGASDKLETTPTVAAWGQHGFNFKEGNTLKHEKAISKDKPTLPGRGNNSGQTFESAALAVEGAQSGTYMGTVSWGWSVDGAGKFTKQPLTLKTKGNPSAEFKAAATQWNKTSVGGTVKTVADPTTVFKNDYTADFTVAKDTDVTVTDAAPIHNDETYDETTIKSGPKANSTGRIKVNDLKETGGTAVIKLPTP